MLIPDSTSCHLTSISLSLRFPSKTVATPAMASVMREANVEVMNKLEGFDVVIICCSSSLQAKYWQQRLEAGRGSILPVSSIVVSVEEDWPGGAGNGDKVMEL